MIDLQQLLDASASRHSHLCPRQVLGVRAGLTALDLLGLDQHRERKQLMVIAETDGCFVDGVEAATGAAVGLRTLRIEDYGKIAATFVDTRSGKAVRIRPSTDSREKAWNYAQEETQQYYVQLSAYQIMPADELFYIQEVQLTQSLEAIISREGVRTNCDRCGEEIINERELLQDRQTLCRSCVGPSYYEPVSQSEECHSSA